MLLTSFGQNATVLPVSLVKVSKPSVRVLTAALLGLFFMPVATSAGTTKLAPDDGLIKVSMSAYNAVPAQTDSNPLVTASGAYSDPDVVMARSADLASKLPYGTVVEIESATSSRTCGYTSVGDRIGLRVVADAMNSKWHNKIDVLLPQKMTTRKGKTVNPAIQLGICNNVTIKVVGHVDINDMPQTQADLASALDASADLAIAK